MAFFYMDTDTGDDADNGTTWALAKLTFEGLLAVMSAGDTAFVQGATTDTAAASRTYTFTGTIKNPNIILGVKDGTTNEGTSIVTSDLVVRGTDTLPKIEVTGTGNDITFQEYATVSGLNFTGVDRITPVDVQTFIDCELTISGQIWSSGVPNFMNCEVTLDLIRLQSGAQAKTCMFGGVLNITNATYAFFHLGGSVECHGVDLSSMIVNRLMDYNTTSHFGHIKLVNCKMPATYAMCNNPLAGATTYIETIGCSDTTSIANDSSLRDYEYFDGFGSIDSETTIVRTGGADDGAAGLFSYAMTPHASLTLESSGANLASPWIAAWTSGGAAKTFTVYIANSTASTDYNEDEVWCEFYTPDSGDTAQHDMTFDPGLARLLNSSTPITDDAVSAWGTGGNNAQKFSMTTTPGFEGWVYARVHLAKRQATPDTLYLDPKIAVT